MSKNFPTKKPNVVDPISLFTMQQSCDLVIDESICISDNMVENLNEKQDMGSGLKSALAMFGGPNLIKNQRKTSEDIMIVELDSQ